MKKTTVVKGVMLFAITLLSWININAQCLNQVFHTSGTETVKGIQITVIPSGDYGTITTYCSGSTQPYLIGANYTYPNHNGSFKFKFSPPIDLLTLNFSGINDAVTDQEIVKIFVNGAHYSIPSVGLPNGCDSFAVLTSLGEITGAENGPVSGWNGTSITGPIHELIVMDSVVVGTPNGSVFSLFICSEHTTSIFEDINSKFLVYPIPSKDNITIDAPIKSKLEIINLQGQVILQEILLQEKNDVDLSILEKGFYILKLNHNGKTEVRKIVKE